MVAVIPKKKQKKQKQSLAELLRTGIKKISISAPNKCKGEVRREEREEERRRGRGERGERERGRDRGKRIVNG
jgi:hypothetical protein